MAAIHIVLFVLTSCRLALCQDITATAVDKAGIEAVHFNEPLDILDALKHDLRKNNDDYVEPPVMILNITNPYLTKTTEITSAGHPATLMLSRSIHQLPSGKHLYKKSLVFNNHPNSYEETSANARRLFASSEKNSLSNEANLNEPQDSNKSRSKFGLLALSLQNVTQASRNTTMETPNPNDKLITTGIIVSLKKSSPVLFNSNQMFHSKDSPPDTSKNWFINSGQNKEFSNEALQQKLAETKGTRPQEMQSSEFPITEATKTDLEDSTHLARLQRRRQSDKVAGNPDFRAGSQPSLTADQLDMAPARGSLIHHLRLRNRMCFRSVLIPEGPKYDSKGHVYLQSYAHRDNVDYQHTRRPTVLLPRCCNCCKKSVLGCQ